MAITVNRTPVSVTAGSNVYKDTNQYFNQIQFKGLCDDKNADTIDPNTFADVENLYIDSNDTLASRPKLVEHDNFGFDTIEKMWIWGDVHLIYGEKTVDNNSVVLLSDVVNEVSLTLTDETLNQIVRIENRIFIFLEGKVYVYEDLVFTQVTFQNIKNYFYIPSDKIIANGIETTPEPVNELTGVTKTTVIGSDNLSFDPYISNGSEVTFTVDDVEYTTTWNTDETYLTLAAPYAKQASYGATMAGRTALVSRGGYLYYTLDGTVWERLPYLEINYDIGSFYGLSKNANFVWAVSNDGLYVISIVATEYPDGTNNPAVKKYENWTRLYKADHLVLAPTNNKFFPSVDMVDWNNWLFSYSTTEDDYVIVSSAGRDMVSSAGGKNVRDAKVYISDGTISRSGSATAITVCFLFFKTQDNTVYLTPFFIDTLEPLVGDEDDLFNEASREVGSFFGPLEDMPIITSQTSSDSDTLNVYWIGKNTDLPPYTGVAFTYCECEVQNGSLTSSTKLLSNSDGSTYVRFGYDPGLRDVGVKFIPKTPTLWLSRKGLIKIGDSFTSSERTFQRVKVTAPIVPISTVNGVREYMFTWRGSRYEIYNDNSVLAFSESLTAFYNTSTTIVANPFTTTLSLGIIKPGAVYTNIYPKHFVETDNTQYWANEENLYIEERRYTEDFKPLLYFPEINTEIRSNKITNLLVIDRGIVALFNEYEVWYITKVTLDDSKIAYAYYKSRIGLGCKEGSDIDILYDGATIIYATPRGVVGMNYQQLTQNTDQILTFLSDSITNTYFPFYADGKIKIFKYKFWTLLYKVDTYECLLLDLRNGSWWYWNSKIEGGFKEVYLYEDKPLILDNNGNLIALEEGHTGVYKDLNIKIIDWKATSQPLNFGAINNYKRINSININNVQLTKDPFNYILICRNYKNQKNIYSPKVVNFEQERITVGSYRTFVKRLNYIQSVKFQYTIANNGDLPVQAPISITAISTKYEIKGRVR